MKILDLYINKILIGIIHFTSIEIIKEENFKVYIYLDKNIIFYTNDRKNIELIENKLYIEE